MGGGDWVNVPTQQIIDDYVDTPQQTYESTEVASVSGVANELSDMTPVEWFILASMICGGLLIIACFVRFTPFSKGVSNLFSTLAKLASKKDK